MSTTISPTSSRQADDIEEAINKLTTFAREYQAKWPEAPPSYCLEIASGKLSGETSYGGAAIISSALTEMAARWVFNPRQTLPEN